MTQLIEDVLPPVQSAGLNSNKAVAFGSTLSVTGTSTLTGAITATGGVSTPAAATLKSATAIPATAGAVAAGAPVIFYSTSLSIEVTSDVPTHTRPKGSICINSGGSSTSTRMYVNTDGAGTWTSFTTAA